VALILWRISFLIGGSRAIATYIGEAAFSILTASYVYVSKCKIKEIVLNCILSTVVVILLCVTSAFSGAVLYDRFPIIGDFLMQTFNIGYYPPGPDVPFVLGAPLWTLSIAGLIAVGVAGGIALRKAFRQNEY